MLHTLNIDMLGDNITTLLVCILGGCFALWQIRAKGKAEKKEAQRKASDDKEHKEVAARAELRKQESRLAMGMMFAVANGVEALIQAHIDGEADGNVEAGLASVRAAKRKYNDFINSTVATQLSK
jgi:hypothetical protein